MSTRPEIGQVPLPQHRVLPVAHAGQNEEVLEVGPRAAGLDV